MSKALHRYKVLVDQLRSISPSSAEAKVVAIDEELQKAWASLEESERLEADAYWRASINSKAAVPTEMN